MLRFRHLPDPRRFLLALTIVVSVAACQSGPPPTSPPATTDPGLLEGNAWPPLGEDLGLTAEARRQCLADLPVPAGIRLAFQDRREPDHALIYFANERTIAWCEMRRGPDGVVPDGGSGTQDLWTRDAGIVVSPSGLGIQTSTRAGQPTEWSNISGLLPPGATSIRAVVDGRVVQGVIGAGIYSLSWPGAAIPIVVVAHDRAGNAVGRIEEGVLSRMWDPRCSPGALGCSTPGP